jgi:hypothetical protein
VNWYRRSTALCSVVGLADEHSRDDAGDDRRRGRRRYFTSRQLARRSDALSGAPHFRLADQLLDPVREIIVKRGQTAELTYRLQLSGESDGTSVSIVELTAVSLDGQPLPSDEADALGAAFVLPDWVVDAQGEVVEVRGIEELLDKFDELGGQPIAPEARSGWAQVLEDAVVTKYWDSWAGFWASYGSIDRAREEFTATAPTRDAEYGSHGVVESVGTTPAGLAILRMTQTLEGDDLARALGGTFESLGAADETGALSGTDAGRRIMTLESVLAPESLRPDSVELTIDIELTMDGETQRGLESRAWSFDWAASDCGP